MFRRSRSTIFNPSKISHVSFSSHQVVAAEGSEVAEVIADSVGEAAGLMEIAATTLSTKVTTMQEAVEGEVVVKVSIAAAAAEFKERRGRIGKRRKKPLHRRRKSTRESP